MTLGGVGGIRSKLGGRVILSLNKRERDRDGSGWCNSHVCGHSKKEIRRIICRFLESSDTKPVKLRDLVSFPSMVNILKIGSPKVLT